MPKQHIPQTGAELTAAWFNEVLAPGSGATVTAVDREVIGEGVGFVGELHRCRLTWSGEANGSTPPSVVVKIPSTISANRSAGEALMAYEREIMIYRDMVDDLGIPAPGYHYGALDPNPAEWIEKPLLWLFAKLPIKQLNWLLLQFIKLSGKSKRRYLLMMDDIADAQPPTQAVGGSIDDALSALGVLARFHAHNWMSSTNTDDPLIWSIDRASRVWQASYLRNRADWVTRFEPGLGSDITAKMDRINADVPAMLERLASAPWTMLHGDYRLDNVLFRPSGDPVVLDYQLCGRGRAGWDVAYFITTALEPEHRSEEERMLHHYHDALVAAGVTDYSFDTLLADCEATKIVLAHRLVCSLDILETQIPDGSDDLLAIMAKRVVGWI